MSKRRYIRAFCALFFLIFCFLSFPIAALTEIPDLESIDESFVLDDLEKFGVDYSEYPKDVNADFGQILYFLEFGYDYSGNTEDYGLYVYYYNPSGRRIQFSSNSNRIIISPKASLGTTVTSWSKYPLTVVNSTTDEPYNNVFYKFRVDGIGAEFMKQLSRDARYYDIVEIEVHYEGETRANAYGAGGEYRFTGFMPYCGPDRSPKNTLWQDVTDRLTIDLDLHSTTWKTATSDKGAGYAYEVFSVYFSVPDTIINDYGDKNDPTKGLVAVEGVYEEYKINGLVTPDSHIYEDALECIGKDPRKVYLPIGFCTDYFSLMGTSAKSCYLNYNFWGAAISKKDVYQLCTAFKEDLEISSISAEEFEKVFFDFVAQNGNIFYYIDPDTGAKTGEQTYRITDEDDLSEQIASYATTHRSQVIAHLRNEYNLYLESKDYGSIPGIQVVSSSDLPTALKTDEAIGESLFIDPQHVDDLAEYVDTASDGKNTTYLLRYAVRDYYCDSVMLVDRCDDAGAFADRYDENFGNSYFEKTIFLNFDVLSLTYENQFSQKTVIPVVCSPVHNLGSVTPSTSPDNMTVIKDTVTDVIDWFKKVGDVLGGFKTWVKVLGIVLILALLAWVLNLLGINISSLIKSVWKIVSWPFRVIRKYLFGSKIGSIEEKQAKAKQETESDQNQPNKGG